MDIGSRIRFFRKLSCMSQRSLADSIGMGQTQLCRYENGGAQPGLPVLKRISEGLGVRVSELLMDQ